MWHTLGYLLGNNTVKLCSEMLLVSTRKKNAFFLTYSIMAGKNVKCQEIVLGK